MKTTQRAFAGEADLQAMLALARLSPADNLHVVDLPYRLSSWALDDPANTGLWTDANGRLLAWAVMQTPFWTIDYACHPRSERHIHAEILDWADRRACQVLDTPYGHPCWFVMVSANQANRIRDLEACGFACQRNRGQDSWSKVLMSRTAKTPVPLCKMPAGFTVRPLPREGEIEAYVALHQSVFESRNMTVAWRARTLGCPEYIPDLDLVAVGPDDRLVAFCICWLGRGTEGSGHIEPLGVRADLQQMGLGRAILSEGLCRLHRYGADPVLVETDSHRNAALRLYESVGFRVIRHILVYRKDYEGQ
jgi:ribosomal protein S18 acetylase RimI-like enzyme